MRKRCTSAQRARGCKKRLRACKKRSLRRKNNSKTRRFAAVRRKKLSSGWRRLWGNNKLSWKNSRGGCATSTEAARPLGSEARGLAFGKNRESRPRRPGRRYRTGRREHGGDHSAERRGAGAHPGAANAGVRGIAGGGKRISRAGPRYARRVLTRGRLVRRAWREVGGNAGQRGGDSDRRANGAEFPVASLRDCHIHKAICGTTGHDEDADSGHAENHAGLAVVGEICGENGRRDESPDGAVRRHSAERESHRAGGRNQGGVGQSAYLRRAQVATAADGKRLRCGGARSRSGRTRPAGGRD